MTKPNWRINFDNVKNEIDFNNQLREVKNKMSDFAYELNFPLEKIAELRSKLGHINACEENYPLSDANFELLERTSATSFEVVDEYFADKLVEEYGFTDETARGIVDFDFSVNSEGIEYRDSLELALRLAEFTASQLGLERKVEMEYFVHTSYDLEYNEIEADFAIPASIVLQYAKDQGFDSIEEFRNSNYVLHDLYEMNKIAENQ